MNINFDKYFNDKIIDFINNEIDKHDVELLGQKRFLDIINDEEIILSKFDLFNNREIKDLIFEYNNIKYREQLCYNWLAYYIGFHYGKNSKKQ